MERKRKRLRGLPVPLQQPPRRCNNSRPRCHRLQCRRRRCRPLRRLRPPLDRKSTRLNSTLSLHHALPFSPRPSATAPAAVQQQSPAVSSPSMSAPPVSSPAAPAAAASAPAPAAAVSTISGAGEFKLPELGENISQGDLVRLMIAPGTKVSEGQPVMELETDKAVVEVPSSVT